jgi:hypothetical protein
VNLKTLITKTFDALFTFSESAESGTLRNKKDVEARLGLANHGDTIITADAASANELNDYQVELAEHYKPKEDGGTLKRTLLDLASMEVRLVDNLVDRLPVVTDALGAGNLAMKRLLGCLKAMCNPLDAINKEAAVQANKHCARKLTEYLFQCKVDDIEASKTREIVRLLLRLIREDALIDRWIEYSGEDHAETLLASSEFGNALITWFESPDIQGRLPKEHLDWIKVAKKSPTATLFEGLAKGHARKWLTKHPSQWISPYFNFINNYCAQANMPTVAPATSSDEPVAADPNAATDLSPEGQDSSQVKGLRDSSAEEILEVARWAKLDEDATWHGSVGFAFWSVDKNDEAIEQYSQALAQNESEPAYHKYIGFSYIELYEKGEERPDLGNLADLAIAHYSKAAALYSVQANLEGVDDAERQNAEEEFINMRLYLAGAHALAKNAETSEEIYRDIVQGWKDRVLKDGEASMLGFAARQYLQTLITKTKDDDAISFLDSVVLHPRSREATYQPILSQLTNLSDEIMKLAYRKERLDVLLNFWRRASFVTACYGTDYEVLDVQFSYATAIIRFVPDRKDHACRLLRLTRTDENAEFWQYSRAEKALARTYLTTALEAMDKDEWDKVGQCYRALRDLTQHNDRPYKNSEAALFLASWYTQRRRPNLAMEAIRELCQSYYNLLFDSEPDNDQHAWYVLGNVALAVGDEDRAIAAFNMCSIMNQESEADSESEDEAESDNEEEPGTIDETQEAKDEGKGEEAEPIAPSNGTSENAPSNPLPALTDADTTETPTTVALPISRTTRDDGIITPPEEPMDTKSAADAEPAVPTGTVDTKQSPSGEAPPPTTDITPEPTSNDSTTPPPNPSATTPPPPIYRWMFCDGPCADERLPSDKPFHRCKICLLEFCSSCQTLIQNDQMPNFALCSSKHDWITVPAFRKCSEEGGNDDKRIFYMGEEVPLREWLEEFREAYGLEKVVREMARGEEDDAEEEVTEEKVIDPAKQPEDENEPVDDEGEMTAKKAVNPEKQAEEETRSQEVSEELGC